MKFRQVIAWMLTMTLLLSSTVCPVTVIAEEIAGDIVEEVLLDISSEPTELPTLELTEQPMPIPTEPPTSMPIGEPIADPNLEPIYEPVHEIEAESTPEVVVGPTSEVASDCTIAPVAGDSGNSTSEDSTEDSETPNPTPTVETEAEPMHVPELEPTQGVTPEPTIEFQAEETVAAEEITASFEQDLRIKNIHIRITADAGVFAADTMLIVSLEENERFAQIVEEKLELSPNQIICHAFFGFEGATMNGSSRVEFTHLGMTELLNLYPGASAAAYVFYLDLSAAQIENSVTKINADISVKEDRIAFTMDDLSLYDLITVITLPDPTPTPAMEDEFILTEEDADSSKKEALETPVSNSEELAAVSETPVPDLIEKPDVPQNATVESALETVEGAGSIDNPETTESSSSVKLYDARISLKKSDSIKCRKGKDKNAAYNGIAANGVMVAVLNEDGEWSYVRTEDGIEGYIQTQYLTRVLSETEKAEALYTATIALKKENRIRIRAEKDSFAEVNGYAAQSATVHVLREEDEWSYIRTEDGVEGYIRAKYLMQDANEGTVEEASFESTEHQPASDDTNISENHENVPSEYATLLLVEEGPSTVNIAVDEEMSDIQSNNVSAEIFGVWYDAGIEGKELAIHVTTNLNTQYVMMYLGDDEIARWSAAESNITENAYNKEWHVSYIFAESGDYYLSYRASVDGQNLCDYYVTSPVVIERPAVIGVWYDTGVEKQPLQIHVTTNLKMQYLIMYMGDTQLASWTADEANITEYATCKEWNVSYTFDEPGPYYLWYKASGDGLTEELPFAASSPVTIERPAVIGVWYDQGIEKKPLQIHVTTNLDMQYLTMYMGDNALASWTAAEADITEYATCKEWNVSYTFDEPGPYYLWYKASGDGTTEELPYGDSTPVTIERPAIISVWYEAANAGEALRIHATTNLAMANLYLYLGDEQLISWTEADVEITEYATCKEWTVEYTFTADGEYYLWYKASSDGVTEEIPFAPDPVTIGNSASAPTVTGFMLNGQAEQLTAAVGATLPFSGTVCAAQDVQLDILQVRIQSALDTTQSTVYYQTSQVGAREFDLSQVTDLIVGVITEGFTMEAGNGYDIILSVTDTTGKGFEANPTIRVNVEEDKSYAVQVQCDQTEAYVGSTVTWIAEAKNGLAPYEYYFQLYKDGEMIATRDYCDDSNYSYTFSEVGEYYAIVLTKDTNNKIVETVSGVVIVSNAETTAAKYFTINSTNDGFATITGYTGTDTMIVIPAQIGDYTIASIGANAFENNTSLINVKMPSTLKTIGSSAFFGCTNLQGIELSEGITMIGSNALMDCTSLTSIQLPDSIQEIGQGAFSGCVNLSKINIPLSWSVAGWYGAFIGCESLKSVTIPEGMTALPDYAFKNANYLENVSLPSTLTTIDRGAFSGCIGITSIELPEGLKKIGWSAFEDCTGLTSIHLPDGVEEIMGGAFSGCVNLSKINIPLSLTTAQWGIFEDCDALKSITIPEGITMLPDRSFSDAASLEDVSLPSTLTTIGAYAFRGCTGIVSIEIPKTVTTIGNSAFEGCTNLQTIELPEGVTAIEERTFSGCTSFTSIHLPDGVEKIGGAAFSECVNLSEINIPLSWKDAVAWIFKGCESLKSITVPEGMTALPIDAFWGSDYLESVSLPSTLTTIGEYAFCDCSRITSIKVPEQVTTIANWTFEGCTNLQMIDLPEGITAIGSDAFKGCISLTSIHLPDGVEEIGGAAFFECVNLSEINIPLSWTTARGRIFQGCESLKSITIPEGMTVLPCYAFEFANCLENVSLPSTLTTIGSSAFRGCTGITSIEFPEGLKKSIRRHSVTVQVSHRFICRMA